jgi:hypothetical protein
LKIPDLSRHDGLGTSPDITQAIGITMKSRRRPKLSGPVMAFTLLGPGTAEAAMRLIRSF